LLSLFDPKWTHLHHAYGVADDLPPLLAQLADLPSSLSNEEPWNTLWSALAHQGDVYDASFAVVPYVVDALAQAPHRADMGYFQFPAWVEICRKRAGIEVPDLLAPSYFAALGKLPSLAAEASSKEWSADFLQCVLAAIAAAKGQTDIAEAALELSPEVSRRFLDWVFSPTEQEYGGNSEA